MTDKQLDELLRRALAPAEQPPELPQAAPRFPFRKAWMGLAAACLCFVVSAGVFLSMDFGAKGEDSAAPDSVFDMMYAESSKAEAVNGAGDLFYDTVLDAVTEESENKSTASGTTAAPETEAPASEPAAPETPAEPEAPAEPEKPTSSELDRAINDFLVSLPDVHSNTVPLITHVGSTEQYLSMMVTTDTAIGYFTTDRSSGAVVSLSEILADESLEKISLAHPEEEKLAQEEVFYVNRDGQVVIFRMPDEEFSPPEKEFLKKNDIN